MYRTTTTDDIIELPDPQEENYYNEFGMSGQDFLSFQSVRMKRTQVAVRACIHCKRLHAKCSNERPCTRCSHNGLADSCVDSPRKPRVGKPKANGSSKGSKRSSPSPLHLSVFSDPSNLVLTGLDGSKMLPSLSSWGLPRIPELHEEDASPMLIPGLKGSPSPSLGSPSQPYSPGQYSPSPVFKTDRLDYARKAVSYGSPDMMSPGMMSPGRMSPGMMSPNLMSPGSYDRIYLPEGDEADNHRMYHKTFGKPQQISELTSSMLKAEGSPHVSSLQSPFSLAAV
jgi:hypothetical protein